MRLDNHVDINKVAVIAEYGVHYDSIVDCFHSEISFIIRLPEADWKDDVAYLRNFIHNVRKAFNKLTDAIEDSIVS